jgi:hypothetical protein
VQLDARVGVAGGFSGQVPAQADPRDPSGRFDLFAQAVVLHREPLAVRDGQVEVLGELAPTLHDGSGVSVSG